MKKIILTLCILNNLGLSIKSYAYQKKQLPTEVTNYEHGTGNRRLKFLYTKCDYCHLAESILVGLQYANANLNSEIKEIINQEVIGAFKWRAKEDQNIQIIFEELNSVSSQYYMHLPVTWTLGEPEYIVMQKSQTCKPKPYMPELCDDVEKRCQLVKNQKIQMNIIGVKISYPFIADSISVLKEWAIPQNKECKL